MGLMEASWSIIFSWDFDYPLFCQKFLPLPDNKERNNQSIDIGEQGDLSVTSCFIVFLILGNLSWLSCLIIEDVRILFLTTPNLFFCFYIYLDCKRAFYSFLRSYASMQCPLDHLHSLDRYLCVLWFRLFDPGGQKAFLLSRSSQSCTSFLSESSSPPSFSPICPGYSTT